VPVEPMKPTLKAPGTKLLKLKYDTPPSYFAFNLNLCRYIEDPRMFRSDAGEWQVCLAEESEDGYGENSDEDEEEEEEEEEDEDDEDDDGCCCCNCCEEQEEEEEEDDDEICGRCCDGDGCCGGV